MNSTNLNNTLINDVSNMEAGRVMDARIAVIMGWRWVSNPSMSDDAFLTPPDQAAKYLPERISEAPPEGWRDNGVWHYCLPHYSTDISAAWEVVEKIAGRNQDTTVAVTRNSLDGKRMGDEADYFCSIEDISDGIEEWEASADTAPLAICRAALLAIESKGV